MNRLQFICTAAIFFMLLFLLPGCESKTQEESQEDTPEETNAFTEEREEREEKINETLSWEDSVLNILETVELDLTYIRKESNEYNDTLQITNPYNLWRTKINDFYLFYWNDMDYNVKSSYLDKANQLALNLNKKKAENNYFTQHPAQQIFDEFNVLNYDRMGKLAKYYGYTYLHEALSADKTTITDSTIITEDSWYNKFEIIDHGDFNRDGNMDLLVYHYESANGNGSYSAGKDIILTKTSAESDITYIPFDEIDLHTEHALFMNNDIHGYIGEDEVILRLNEQDGVRVTGEVDYINTEYYSEVYGFILGNGYIYLNVEDGSEFGLRLEGRIINNVFSGLAYEPAGGFEYPYEFAFQHTIAEGIIWRYNLDSLSNKWEGVYISNIFGFKSNVPYGDLVQILPLRKELPILELPIKETKYRNDVYEWYEVDLAPVENLAYHNIASIPGYSDEYPGEVICIYPPIEGCQLIPTDQLSLKDLPNDVTIDIVKAAIDFNGDNIPDALVLDFCCKNRKPPYTDGCEYHCGETYLKINHKWVLVDTSSPM